MQFLKVIMYLVLAFCQIAQKAVFDLLYFLLFNNELHFVKRSVLTREFRIFYFCQGFSCLNCR
jgi:hypothetical protein